MLTNQNIVEILDKIGKDVNAKLSGRGVLFTKDGSSSTWTRQGTVHDVDEAMKTIDEWFAKNNPAMTRKKTKRVRVMAVRDDGSMDEVSGDFDGLTVEELISRITQYDKMPDDGTEDAEEDADGEDSSALLGDSKEGVPKGLSEAALAALDAVARNLLNNPTMRERPEEVDADDWKVLVEGYRETGIPPKLLGAICAVLEPMDEPGNCNCGHCIANRLYPEVDPSSMDDLMKFAALKRIVSTMGPQRGDCRLPLEKRKKAAEERTKQIVDSIEKRNRENAANGESDNDGGSSNMRGVNKSTNLHPRWFRMKKVEGEQ